MTPDRIATVFAAHRLPPRLSLDDRDLDNARVLAAVHLLRTAGDGNLLNAATEALDPQVPTSDFDSNAARYGVTPSDVFRTMQAVQAVRWHGLDERTVAAFGALPYSDGAVTVVAAAGLSAGEISDLVRRRTRPNVPALLMLATLRGYQCPAPDASGDPASHADSQQE